MIRRVRRLLASLILVCLVAPASALALLTPGRTVSNVAPVTALSVTSRSVVWAVGRSKRDCGHVRLWDTAMRGLWTFGSRTIRGCEEGPSGGFGIGQVATSSRRAFWVTSIGGNITDYQLWTATPTRPAPQRLAFASSDTDGPAAIVLGSGTAEGVPYAVGETVTYVGGTGARLFQVQLDSPVRLLTAGTALGGPDSGSVLAALANGKVVELSRSGAQLRADTFSGPVRAIALATLGPVVQAGNVVTVEASSTVTRVTLPPNALMLDYRQRAIAYRLGAQLRLRRVGTGEDTLLGTFPVKPWQPLLFSTDTAGSASAMGATVSWRSGPLG
jgi:hypothetical protein